MVTEADLILGDGRTLHYYDTAESHSDPRVPVFWQHGTPNLGSPPAPLFAAAERSGLRFVSHDRPSYGGSSPNQGRDVAADAADVAAIADAIGVGRFCVFGHSGGGSRALACAALRPDRVIAAVCCSSPAPMTAAGLDWYAGWSAGTAAENRAAAAGPDALAKHLATAEFDPDCFSPADEAALGGPWAWLAGVAGAAFEQGPDGMVADLLAAAGDWGFSPAAITVPVLVMHGDDDRMVPASHSRWLASQIPDSGLRLVPGAGHITVLDEAPAALTWLGERAAG